MYPDQTNICSSAIMKRYRVLVGAPSMSVLASSHDLQAYEWHQVSAAEMSVAIPHPGFPSTALEAASRRISRIYENIIFKDAEDVEDEDERFMQADSQGQAPGKASSSLRQSQFGTQPRSNIEQTTLITWPPTQDPNLLQSRANTTTFFRASPSRIQETQETQEGTSYNYSDASSIARFPDFQFTLHALTDLSMLKDTRGSRKVSLLLAVLEVEGPDSIRLKKGADADKEIYVFKTILGNEAGVVCKLTAWREVAETWGGIGQSTGIKRGDVVYFESKRSAAACLSCCEFDDLADVQATWDPQSPLVLTASPHLKSRAEICYRTMPRAAVPEDGRLRPDLRLGYSDATVRKVASIVSWFEKMAGLLSA
ncbi:hypothetical protein EVG20_g2977 [Dentipellis fragilis]|uniref:Uncharacterized protein n=1 Tax=Dentipellis fragilis TaxID=205917 RepID=A0A4Y9Z7P1_9AGAM|nr:hypothetical protein EVG20_g2977 [Dentipellis fragilis]